MRDSSWENDLPGHRGRLLAFRIPLLGICGVWKGSLSILDPNCNLEYVNVRFLGAQVQKKREEDPAVGVISDIDAVKRHKQIKNRIKIKER